MTLETDIDSSKYNITYINVKYIIIVTINLIQNKINNKKIYLLL